MISVPFSFAYFFVCEGVLPRCFLCALENYLRLKKTLKYNPKQTGNWFFFFFRELSQKPTFVVHVKVPPTKFRNSPQLFSLTLSSFSRLPTKVPPFLSPYRSWFHRYLHRFVFSSYKMKEFLLFFFFWNEDNLIEYQTVNSHTGFRQL